MTHPLEHDNPYRSPQSETTLAPEALRANWLDHCRRAQATQTAVEIPLRITPRDPLDWLISVFVDGYLLVWRIGVPVLLAWLLQLPIQLGFVPLFVAVVVSRRTQIHSLKLDHRGLHFRCRAGLPRPLAWERIESITPVSTWEVLLRGWLWPLVPRRERTSSMSTTGYYRSRWDGGFTFYPPNNAEQFELALRVFRSQLLSHPAEGEQRQALSA